MVMTLAEGKARMPPKQRGNIRKQYSVDVVVTKFLGGLQYRAGGGRLLNDLRFLVRENRVLLRKYKPGDWESALKRAYDDLLAQAGIFAGLSVRPPELASDVGKTAHTSRRPQPQEAKGIFDRVMALFTKSED